MANEFGVLSWGKPSIYVGKLDGSNAVTYKKWYTPVLDSTQLETTKGDKSEAKIEGGENEAVRYAKNTYALTLSIRAAKGRKKPVSDSDGIVAGEYSLILVPEDPTAPGLKIDRATISVEDTWSAADGGTWAYTFDALKPATGDQVKWGVATVSGTDETPTISFVEDSEGDESSSD